MSPLAQAIYNVLRLRCSHVDPRITYSELAQELCDMGDRFEHIHRRSRELFAALGEVGRECGRLKLPPLPALVVRADSRRPGAAYYSGKGSGIVYKAERIAAWRRDLEAVKRARYPVSRR